MLNETYSRTLEVDLVDGLSRIFHFLSSSLPPTATRRVASHHPRSITIMYNHYQGMRSLWQMLLPNISLETSGTLAINPQRESPKSWSTLLMVWSQHCLMEDHQALEPFLALSQVCHQGWVCPPHEKLSTSSPNSVNPGPPPGTSAAPGVGSIPPVQQAQGVKPSRPGGFPPNFQPPANMPNINFSAPVIRLGIMTPSKPATPMTGSSGGRRDGAGDGLSSSSARAGVGSGPGGVDHQRQHLRESMAALAPPTR